MSQIVLVHGIGQEQEQADPLEQVWLPALAGGVRAAKQPGLADRLWRDSKPGDLECRMVFYGDLFLAPGRMGNSQTVDDLTLQQQELATELAVEWLRQAEQRARETEDRDEAYRQRHTIDGQTAGRQGMRAAGRPVLNALARLRWFAPAGMTLAERFADRSLAQLTRYLTEEALREEVQRRMAQHVGAETVAIIGHSLGSVVAFQAAHRLTRELPLLITLGSPLGLRTLVYDRLPEDKEVPAKVRRWVNLAARDDLVAAVLDLRELFKDPRGVLESDWTLDTGSEPHQAKFYLTKEQAGAAVAAAFQ
ncbi:hypothetical protein ABTX60_42960 [Streptomyces sp. NPDC126510]|uniref:hypothetical protein n=1 Tax=Streptomyces sp. NPDC126510 TaxID=3155317 RepID=UPI00332471B7